MPMNKELLLAAALIAAASLCRAQSVVVAFDYDAAGNRIARRVVADSPQLSPPRMPAQGHETGTVAVSPTITDGPVTVTTTADVTVEALPWTLADAQGRVTATGRLTEAVTPLHIDCLPSPLPTARQRSRL